MFFVYDFLNDDFRVIGGFTKKADADAFAEREIPDRKMVWVVENTFDAVIEQALAARLGELARLLLPTPADAVKRLYGANNTFPLAVVDAIKS